MKRVAVYVRVSTARKSRKGNARRPIELLRDLGVIDGIAAIVTGPVFGRDQERIQTFQKG